MNTLPNDAVWVKSTYSGSSGGQCVEYAPALAITGAVPVRDSKNPAGPALVFPTKAWGTFVDSLKNEPTA